MEGNRLCFYNTRNKYELSSGYRLLFIHKIACLGFHFLMKQNFYVNQVTILGKSGKKQMRANKEGIRARRDDGLGNRAFRGFKTVIYQGIPYLTIYVIMAKLPKIHLGSKP
ncbi:MAG: hypothetical protein R6W88_06295 [Desulfobacterales bacterium]